MESTDESVQQARKKMLMDACSTQKTKAYLMHTSMINSVRESYLID